MSYSIISFFESVLLVSALVSVFEISLLEAAGDSVFLILKLKRIAKNIPDITKIDVIKAIELLFSINPQKIYNSLI